MAGESFTIEFILSEKKVLRPKDAVQKERLKMLHRHAPGTKITAMFYIDAEKANAAKLAKIHAMIKDLANETKNSQNDIKKELKRLIGFTYVENEVLCYRSFAQASEEELSNAIEQLILLGEFGGLDFKQQY